MPRARNIKPGLFKNELLGEADPMMSLTFIGLWILADKEGRLEDRPKRIKAELFPYRDDIKIDEILAWLMDNAFINRYCFKQEPSKSQAQAKQKPNDQAKHGSSMAQARVKHDPYIQILNWEKHQHPHHKEKDSEIPSLSVVESSMTQARAMHDSSITHLGQPNPSDSLIPYNGFSDTHATHDPFQELNDADACVDTARTGQGNDRDDF